MGKKDEDKEVMDQWGSGVGAGTGSDGIGVTGTGGAGMGAGSGGQGADVPDAGDGGPGTGFGYGDTGNEIDIQPTAAAGIKGKRLPDNPEPNGVNTNVQVPGPKVERNEP